MKEFMMVEYDQKVVNNSPSNIDQNILFGYLR